MRKGVAKANLKQLNILSFPQKHKDTFEQNLTHNPLFPLIFPLCLVECSREGS